MHDHDHDHDHECAGCAGRDIIADEDDAIARTGVNFSLVMGHAAAPGFIYTSGLSEKGLADLIFVGDHARVAAGYLMGFVHTQMKTGTPATPGYVPGGHPANPYEVPMWLIPASDKLETHAYGVNGRLSRINSLRAPTLYQVVIPDKVGRFPWEHGYAWLDQNVTNPPIHGNA